MNEQGSIYVHLDWRVGDLSNVVLSLYGALPFPDEQNPNRNLGYLKSNRTLVMVDSSSKITGYATLAPKVKGKRKICVKAVDVFGFESVVVEEVGNAE